MNNYIKLTLQKSLIKMPEHKRPIPSVWKGMWKKALSSGGTINCRQVGCTYTCSSLEDMCEHVSKCNFTPEEVYITIILILFLWHI